MTVRIQMAVGLGLVFAGAFGLWHPDLGFAVLLGGGCGVLFELLLSLLADA